MIILRNKLFNKYDEFFLGKRRKTTNPKAGLVPAEPLSPAPQPRTSYNGVTVKKPSIKSAQTSVTMPAGKKGLNLGEVMRQKKLGAKVMASNRPLPAPSVTMSAGKKGLNLGSAFVTAAKKRL